MPRSIDQIQDVLFPVFPRIVEANCVSLDRDAALALEIHIIEQLGLHIALGNCARYLQQTVSKGRFAMVDMGNDREVSNKVKIHSSKANRNCSKCAGVSSNVKYFIARNYKLLL